MNMILYGSMMCRVYCNKVVEGRVALYGIGLRPYVRKCFAFPQIRLRLGIIQASLVLRSPCTNFPFAPRVPLQRKTFHCKQWKHFCYNSGLTHFVRPSLSLRGGPYNEKTGHCFAMYPVFVLFQFFTKKFARISIKQKRSAFADHFLFVGDEGFEPPTLWV